MKNKFVLLFSGLFSVVFLLSIFKITHDFTKIEQDLIASPNVVDLTDQLQTRFHLGDDLSGAESLDFKDSDWTEVKLPSHSLTKAGEGQVAWYRIHIPKAALDEVKHLKDEVSVNFQYIMFSEASIFVNGRLYQTIRPSNGLESFLNIPIKEDQDNLIAIKGKIATGDTGLEHRGRIMAGKTGELNQIHTKSYKNVTVFSLIFFLCKGSILFVFTLIFLVVKVQRYFEQFLIFAMLVISEDLIVAEYTSQFVKFDYQVLLYNLVNVGIISALFLFLSDVLEKRPKNKTLLKMATSLFVVSFVIAIDCLYTGKVFTLDHFLQFWRLAHLSILIYFIPQIWSRDKVMSLIMLVAVILVSWSFIEVKRDFKAHANLLLFFMVGYQTFILFRKEQNLLKEKETQLLEQEKDVAIGKTAAVLAHDVRRPLEQMKLILNRLSTGEVGEDFIKGASRDVDYSITSANNLINDIMNFSKTRNLELVPVSFYKILNGAMKQVLSINHNVDLDLQYDFKASKMVLTDESSLSGVLSNLLSNAVEAIRDIGNRNSGKLIFKTEIKENTFVFRIFNDGPTIPEHILPEITKPLFTHGKKQGTGLGLASVAKVIREHGGSLSVRNIENKGVEFSFTLKSSYEQDQIPDFKTKSSDYSYAPSSQAKVGKEFRIFLLDDDRQVYEYFHHMSQNLSFNVEISYAGNVEEALPMIKAKRFDLYILDYDLASTTTGLDFYHDHLSYLSTEVVIHTNRESSLFKNENCRHALKPMSPETLQELVNELDGKRQKVLLVDDSELTRMVWEMFHGSHNIKAVKSPEEALDVLGKTQEFQVCVLDYYYDNSQMNGVELADRIKAEYPQLNILISSNSSIECAYKTIAKDQFEIRS